MMELKLKISYTLDYMIGWFSANGLAMNMEKTDIMKITSSYHQNEAFQIIYQKKDNNWNKHYNIFRPRT
jgi:hypothetical protein